MTTTTGPVKLPQVPDCEEDREAATSVAFETLRWS